MLALNALIVRLFARPAVLALLSLVTYVLLAYWIPQQFEASQVFRPLADTSQSYAAGASLILLGYAALMGLSGYYKYWQWSSGETPSCPRCGMMMEVRSGRRGMFWGCLRYPACRGTEDY